MNSFPLRPSGLRSFLSALLCIVFLFSCSGGGGGGGNPGTLAVAPVITTQPADQSVVAGQSVSFTVKATGTAPLVYQWQKDGVLLGTNSATFSIASVTAAQAGNYLVRVSNSVGSVTSATATLTVTTAAVAPSVITQPEDQTVREGQSTAFTVEATGTAPLSYQWKKDGASINGANSATYTLPAVTMADAGSYTVTINNSAGNLTSNAATLTVTSAATAPQITTQPQNETVTAGQSASFTITASGIPAPTFTWEKSTDGGGSWASISGATSATVSFTTVIGDSAARFRAKASNSAGTAISSGATLTVTAANVAPVITAQPASQTVNWNQSVTFSVAAEGSATLHYQWMKGTVPVGSDSANLTISNAQMADAGSYTVTITNTAGIVTSNSADLTVTPMAPQITAPVEDRSVDYQDIYGGFTVGATGTPPLHYQWTKDGKPVGKDNNWYLGLYYVLSADAGVYAVTVSNDWGSVTSSATLTVNNAPPSAKVLFVGLGNSIGMVAWLYDPDTNTWSMGGFTSNSRYTHHTATRLNNGQVLVTGGSCVQSELYDPSTDTWAVTGSLNVHPARELHTATLIQSNGSTSNGKVLVAGGKVRDNDPSLSDAELYDPQSGTWTSVSDMPAVRAKHKAFLLGTEITVVGGLDNENATALDSTYNYRPNSTGGTWFTMSTTLNHARYDFAATTYGAEIIVVGGTNGDGTASSTLEMGVPGYNWTSIATPISLSGGHTATCLGNGKILVVGGDTGINSCWLFDPSTKEWSSAAPLNHGRADHTATLLVSGKVLVSGGAWLHPSGSWMAIPSNELYDPSTNTWSDAGMQESTGSQSTCGLTATLLSPVNPNPLGE